MWMYLKDRTKFFEQSFHVLHIAPEACFIKRFEKIHGDHYITADIESPLAKVKMDIHQIPFEQNTFDAVLCNHVLEHVRDDIKAISEINRVLKPGGFAILQVPFFNPVGATTFEDPTITDKREREKIFGQDDHVRKYGDDYPARIQKGGLRPMAEHYIDEISEDVRKKFGLTKGEIIYGGTKLPH
jgi:SAM-dependent methyltransferase